MTGADIAAIASGLANLVCVVAGLFGLKKHQEVKASAEKIERAGEAVIQGVEACEKILEGEDAKRVKQSVQAVAEAAGVEGTLHNWLVKLGLAKNKKSD